MRSVYIHIPFCSSICSYCDFCKMLYVEYWADKYLEVLKEEILNFYEGEEISSIYIGGGTPSVLNNEQLIKLFDIISIFKYNKKSEFTFEMNINDINEELLLLLRKGRVNRLSIGIESFNKYNLKFLNRKHNKKDIIKAIKQVKEFGFNNFNVDLIYALPIETFSMLKNDVKKILNFKPTHISTYSLIVEKNTALEINNVKPISEDLDYRMYKYICKKLKNKGYIHYEVSNFSLYGFESIHNLNYWNNNEYYGFGLGAHGYISSVRYENTRSLNKYLNKEFRKSELFISKKDDMENEVMLCLRKRKGLNIRNFYDKFHINIQEVFDFKDLIKNKLLILKDNYLIVPESKVYILNEILNMIFK